ncbi:MAG: hypothetical protein IBJ18_03785 [Phycisphaerales bacterium]|nr:hypothetical protein [Phycisphaerales bacterium]
MLQILPAISASFIGLLSSLGMIVMLMAGMANAKERQLRQGKRMMLAIAVMEVAALAGAVWLMVEDRPWLASAVGIFPLVAVVVLLIVLVKIEW